MWALFALLSLVPLLLAAPGWVKAGVCLSENGVDGDVYYGATLTVSEVEGDAIVLDVVYVEVRNGGTKEPRKLRVTINGDGTDGEGRIYPFVFLPTPYRDKARPVKFEGINATFYLYIERADDVTFLAIFGPNEEYLAHVIVSPNRLLASAQVWNNIEGGWYSRGGVPRFLAERFIGGDVGSRIPELPDEPIVPCGEEGGEEKAEEGGAGRDVETATRTEARAEPPRDGDKKVAPPPVTTTVILTRTRTVTVRASPTIVTETVTRTVTRTVGMEGTPRDGDGADDDTRLLIGGLIAAVAVMGIAISRRGRRVAPPHAARWAPPVAVHRCPSCGYPLAGTESVCPNCGYRLR